MMVTTRDTAHLYNERCINRCGIREVIPPYFAYWYMSGKVQLEGEVKLRNKSQSIKAYKLTYVSYVVCPDLVTCPSLAYVHSLFDWRHPVLYLTRQPGCAVNCTISTRNAYVGRYVGT